MTRDIWYRKRSKKKQTKNTVIVLGSILEYNSDESRWTDTFSDKHTNKNRLFSMRRQSDEKIFIIFLSLSYYHPHTLTSQTILSTMDETITYAHVSYVAYNKNNVHS